MNNLSIRQKISAGFGAILLVLAVICAFGYVTIERIEEHAAFAKNDPVPGLHLAGQIETAIAQDFAVNLRPRSAPPEQRGELRADSAASRAQIEQLFADYDRTITQAHDRRLFQAVKDGFAGYSRLDGQARDAQFGQVMAAARVMTEDNHRRAIAAVTEVDEELIGLEQLFLASVILAILIAVGAATILRRSIMRPLGRLGTLMETMRQGDFTQRMEIEQRDEFGMLGEGFNRMADEVMGLVGQVQKSGIRVSTSMTEIAATAKQQQATATEVAATTTEIGATSREISATSRELVRTMNEVASVAENAAGLATTGQSGLSQMESTMGQVMEAGASINAKLAVLNEKAGNINQIVTTITKVADQINLLSLNAAIEAEKAGEYGRGFAVVSSEIRRLADQTAVATYDIEETVKEIQSAVSAGVMGMDKFSAQVRQGMEDVQQVGGSLSEVIDMVQALVPRFETVNEGMQAQATGAEQISEALLQLTEATQQTVESLRQSGSAIDDLNQVSGNLHSSISRFKLAAA